MKRVYLKLEPGQMTVPVLRDLGVAQATCDDPYIRCHHRRNAKYDQVFHVVILFISQVLKSLPPPCACTLRSTQPAQGCPQRSQLQPGAPSGGRTVGLIPATFCNVSFGDPGSSVKKRIAFIGCSFVLEASACSQRMTPPGLPFAVQKLRRARTDDVLDPKQASCTCR